MQGTWGVWGIEKGVNTQYDTEGTAPCLTLIHEKILYI